MLDSNATEQRRPSLSTSLSDFALLPSTSSAPSSPSSNTGDDGLSPFFRRLRRSSLLATHPITADPDGKPSSPLITSFIPRFSFDMGDNSSSLSPSATPSLLFDDAATSSTSPTTPPRPTTSSTQSADPPDHPLRRRVSLPLKPARLLDLRSELRSPIESELKSEAQFQRLIASYSYTGFPLGKHLPRTPRAWADRGRYPEEAGGDEEGSQGADSTSDEGEDETASASASAAASMSMTPSGSGSGSGEDHVMTIETNIVGPFMMDIDTPATQSAVSSPTQWRQTPPPTSSGVRSNKRKFDDRYDPYLTAKRRAVSPSVHHLHHSHSHSHLHSHAHSHTHPHLHSHHRPRSGSISHVSPISIPIPRSSRSVTSSPVLRPTSSPVMRATSFPGNSPVLQGKSPTARPLARLTLRGGSDGERERERSQRGVDGAGEAVSSLSIA